MNYPCPKTPRLEPALLRWLPPRPPLTGKYSRRFTNRREELMRATSGNHVLLVQCRQKATYLCERPRARSRVLKDQQKKSTTFWINSTPFAKKSTDFTGNSTANPTEEEHKLQFPTCKTHQAKRKKASSTWLHAKNYLLLSYDNLILSSSQSHWQWKSLMLMSKLSTTRLTSLLK